MDVTQIDGVLFISTWHYCKKTKKEFMVEKIKHMPSWCYCPFCGARTSVRKEDITDTKSLIRFINDEQTAMKDFIIQKVTRKEYYGMDGSRDSNADDY